VSRKKGKEVTWSQKKIESKDVLPSTGITPTNSGFQVGEKKKEGQRKNRNEKKGRWGSKKIPGGRRN